MDTPKINLDHLQRASVVVKNLPDISLHDLGIIWVREMISRQNGNRTKAAKKLQISTRSVFRIVNEILRLGFHVTKYDIKTRCHTPKGFAYENRARPDCQE